MHEYLHRLLAFIPGQFALHLIVFVLFLGTIPAAALALEPGEFNPADFDSLLHLYVRDGAVAYGQWKEDGTAALDGFLQRAADYDLTSTLGKEPRAAFLINAYNAWAIRQVLDHYPVASLKDIPGFFDKNAVRIAGEKRTLDDIEATLAEILPYRPLFSFALSPGAVGMPPLAQDAYTSEKFDARIGQAASRTILDGKLVTYDRTKNQLHLPVQFQRHFDSFQKVPRGVMGFLGDYIPLADLMIINHSHPDYMFDPVDWTLRDATGKRPEATGKETAP